MDHCSIKENVGVSLHDCRTDHIEYAGEAVTFRFPKGFYFLEGDRSAEDRPAQMRCHIADHDPDGFSASVCRKNRFGKVIREDWSQKLIPAINSGRCEFEFVTTYRAYGEILFRGYLWFDKKPYHIACEIELHTDEITYTRLA